MSNKTTYTALRLCYIANDYIMSLAGILLFDVFRYHLQPRWMEPRSFDEWLLDDPRVRLSYLLFPLMMMAIYAISGYYNYVEAKSRLNDIYNSAVSGLIATLVIYFLILIDNYLPVRAENYQMLLILWTCMSLPVCAGRIIITALRRNAMRKADGIYPAIIIGTDKAVANMQRKVRPANSRAIPMFRISATAGPDISDDDIRRLIADTGASAIIITPHPDGLQATMNLIARLYPLNLSLYLPHELHNIITSHTRITNVAYEPLINISNANIPPATENIKRLSDIIFSSLALVALMPVFAAIAVAIKLDSPGPVFYRQPRVGRHKKIFNIIKFRTMQVHAEPNGPTLSVADDPRVTRTGRVLRKYRLDELPQFWNVLRGEMSVVGPRPEREYFVKQIVKRVPYYSLIHQVRPGITSWGMVKYGYASDVDEMIERLSYDLLYIENISFGVDIKILFHTVSTVLTGKGL